MLITDLRSLPNADERPDADDTPVDNEDQNFLPNLLLATLYRIWQERQDWFFAVDMG
ncbi:MAG: Uma2 family endonuclease, partial [Cyanobacteria bacterium RI_101]|nr:Uma2 family endonuclease [Cyanobacteria bacterium RI_101]